MWRNYELKIMLLLNTNQNRHCKTYISYSTCVYNTVRMHEVQHQLCAVLVIKSSETIDHDYKYYLNIIMTVFSAKVLSGPEIRLVNIGKETY